MWTLAYRFDKIPMGLPVEVKHDFEGGIISIFYHLTFSTEKIPILATGKMAIINRVESEFGHRVSIIKFLQDLIISPNISRSFFLHVLFKTIYLVRHFIRDVYSRLISSDVEPNLGSVPVPRKLFPRQFSQKVSGINLYR